MPDPPGHEQNAQTVDAAVLREREGSVEYFAQRTE